MSRLRRLLDVRPLRLVLYVLAVAVVWQVFVAAGQDGRVAPAVRAAVDAQSTVAVVVHFSFEAEPFHLRYLQDRGVLSGTEPRAITLRRVTPEDVVAMSRQYWIDRVELASD
ncbi:hypothetical protein [Euzebya pacifica]|uniref:hypothetical protein n=1 Tax=Euzebya pacifica TaxID=1608957 RepID=UPI0030FA8E51